MDAAGNRTKYSYDVCGNCTAITYADGASVQLSYDGCRRLTGISAQGASGTVSVDYAYDSMGNLTAYTDELGNTTRYVYDRNSRLTEVYDAENHKTASYTYDAVGHVMTMEDTAGIISTYTYNQFDQPERIVLTAPSGEERTYSCTYDDFGRLLSVTAPDGTVSGQTYDTYGNVTGVISPMGGVTGYTYDNLGRITQETLSIGTKTLYTYNMDGFLSKYVNGRGQETAYAYDALGRLSELTDAEGSITYTYDANGNILTETETDKNGETYTITRTYDSRNRVTSVTDYKGDTVSYGYDELGNRISLTYAGGEIVRYTYLANGLMESMVDGEGYRTSYTYDKLGNVTTIQKPDGSVERYTYDSACRMTKHTVEAAGETVEDTYVYDAWGNIVSMTHTGAGADGIRTPETLVMTYDSANRMVSINGEEVRYDEDGNMTYGPVDGVMTELVYDSRNRLVQAGDTTYEYDADNIRTAVTTPEYREEYTVDREGSISRILDISRTYTDGRTETERYYYGTGLVYEAYDYETPDGQPTTGRYIYHFNHLGSTTMLTDAEGNIVDTYAYGTYGELLPAAGQEGTNHDNSNHDNRNHNTITRFLYNGEYGVCTDDNGLYYMRARYYSPDIRRFINQDVLTGSIEDAASLNRYSYVEGNPVSYTDPFGLSPFMTAAHTGLGIGGIFCPILNVVDAGLYFLEGNTYLGIESLVFAFAGGKSAQYLAKAGKYFGVGAKVTEGISKACTIGVPLFAAHDTGTSINFFK